MQNLFEKSISIILQNQSKEGAFIASPEFPTYHFCWMRDGSFIAYAMDTAGKYDAAEKFYSWVDRVINRYGSKLDVIEEKLSKGEKLEKGDFLNARYTMEGYDEEDKGWGNFQLDGYGTWLWGLAQHVKFTNKVSLIEDYKNSINTSIRYIEKLWFYPNYDVWEENSDKIHTSTLACLYGGLISINKYLKREDVKMLACSIKTFILTNCTLNNSFIKYIGTDEVDSSLTWLGIPFNVVDVNSDIFQDTLNRIEKELVHNYGAHRYAKDTYYGGGEWILLSCSFALCCLKRGEYGKAEAIKKWVESQADENGNLTEQVCSHVNNEIYYPYWVKNWGEVAKPLLWSHAMYIILTKEIEKM